MNTIEIFCCYAPEDRELLLKLKKQLAPLLRYQLINTDFWYDARILPGAEWGREVYQHLNSAHIILLLISPDFMDSDHCYDIEMKRAIERHERGEAHVIPVILRPVHWQKAPFGALQALPQDAQPVTSWRNLDEALFNVTEGINKVIESISPKPLGEPLSAASRLKDTAEVPVLTRSRVSALASPSWKWDQYTVSQTLVLHHSEPIASITLSSDDTALASDGWDNTLLYWKIYPDKAQRERTLTQLSRPLYTVSFKPNDSLVASGGDDAIVRIWDSETGREVKTLKGHTGPVSCVAFSPDGNLLASASYDTSVRVWNPSQGDLLSTLTYHRDTVHCVTFLSSVMLASGDHSGSILIFYRSKEVPLVVESKGGEHLLPKEWDVARVLQQPGPVYSIAAHQLSGALISGAHDGILRIWELSTGQLLQTFTEHKKAVSCVAISSTGSIIVSGSLDKTIQVRRMEISRRSGSPSPLPDPLPLALQWRHQAEHWLSEGIQHSRAREYEQALKDYEQAFRCDPALGHHLLNSEYRYLRLNRSVLQEILSHCERAISNNQQKISIHLLKSYTLLFLGRPQEALMAHKQAVALDSYDGRLFFLRDQMRWSLRRSQFHRQKIICRYLLLGAACGIVLMGIASATSPGSYSPNPLLWIGEFAFWISSLASWIWSLVNAVRLRRWGWFISLFLFMWLAVFAYVVAGRATETPFLKTKEK